MLRNLTRVFCQTPLQKLPNSVAGYIHNKAKSFRKIVEMIDMFEKVGHANGLTQIDENIAQEVLGG